MKEYKREKKNDSGSLKPIKYYFSAITLSEQSMSQSEGLEIIFDSEGGEEDENKDDGNDQKSRSRKKREDSETQNINQKKEEDKNEKVIPEISFDDEDDEKGINEKKENPLYSLVYLKRQSELKAWTSFFEQKEVQDEIKKISVGLQDSQREGVKIFPSLDLVFRAFEITAPQDIKCVIVGQDPYHDQGSAGGLCFSIWPGRKINPSMRNIQKVVKESGFKVTPNKGDLINWAQQGVFLYNAALTVEEGDPKSQTELWSDFTRLLFKYLNRQDIVWMLWGKDAQAYKDRIASKYKIKTSHPSPNSAYRGDTVSPAFISSKCFSRCNELLTKLEKEKINWDIL